MQGERIRSSRCLSACSLSSRKRRSSAHHRPFHSPAADGPSQRDPEAERALAHIHRVAECPVSARYAAHLAPSTTQERLTAAELGLRQEEGRKAQLPEAVHDVFDPMNRSRPHMSFNVCSLRQMVKRPCARSQRSSDYLVGGYAPASLSAERPATRTSTKKQKKSPLCRLNGLNLAWSWGSLPQVGRERQ